MMFFHAWCCGTSWNLNSVGCAPLCLQNCGHAKQHKYTKLYIISTHQFSVKILQNMLWILTVFIISTGGIFTENWLSVQLGNSLKIYLPIFENGPMPTPTKLRNPTIVGSGDPDSAQWSHPSRFCLWHPLFGNNGNPPFKTNTQYKNLFSQKDCYFVPTQAQIPVWPLGTIWIS